MKVKQRVAALLTAVLLGVVGGAVVLAAPAAAGEYGPYKIVHSESNLCLQVPNGSMAFGEQLTLGVCGPNPTWYQLFWFDDACCAWRYFIRPGHNMWCVVPGNVALFRSTIIQWGCNWGDGSQVWWLQDTAQNPDLGNRRLVSSKGYYLNVDPPSVGEYARQGSPSNIDPPHPDYWKLIHA